MFAYESAHTELLRGFEVPNPEFSPVPLWWWSGERVELSRLQWQLDQLLSQGVHNVVVINLAPTGPIYGALADDPPLFSESWWSLWKGLATYAKQRGARLWFYDQLGFSGANIQATLVGAEPEFVGASLRRLVVDGDGHCELSCPSTGVPIAASVLPLDDADNVIGPPAPLTISGRCVQFHADQPTRSGGHRVVLAYAERTGFDYTSPAACATLIDTVHGEFARRLGEFIGDVIVGSFQDELPSVPTWSKSFGDEFAWRCGYRIEPVIAALWEDWGAESARVRIDYQRVRAALAEEAFFRPLHEWHQTRGLNVGVDQQSPSRVGEPLGCTAQYADYMRTHRWYSAPGSDHFGDAKVHSSLAHHYGRPRTWIEAFHSSGWGGTLEDTFEWLIPWLLAGATLYNPHAVYYSTRGGWWEWAPPSTCWRQPYWKHYRPFADTVSRLCWLLTRGEHVCDVAVLFPTTTVQAGTLLTGPLAMATRAHQTYLDLVGRMVWDSPSLGALNRARFDFDVLDDDTVASASVSAAALHTRGESYRAVVVPACTFVESRTASALCDLAAQGGLVIVVGDLPEYSELSSSDEVVRDLRLLIDSGEIVHVGDVEEVGDALERLGRSVESSQPTLRRRVGECEVLLVSAATPGQAGRDPRCRTPVSSGHEYDDSGPDCRVNRTVVKIVGAATDIEQWDPLTGTARPAQVDAADVGGVEVSVMFDQGPVAILVWKGDDGHVEFPGGQSGRSWRTLSLDGPWIASLDRTTDNTYGDFALPAHPGPLPVQQWRLLNRCEEDIAPQGWHRPDFDDRDWGEVLVDHGTWAWRFGPVAPAAVPQPLSTSAGGLLREPGWAPVQYSLSRGIENDPVHTTGPTFGPKGRVPDEFWHVEHATVGEIVVFRTGLPIPSSAELTLAVAANGSTDVWWNGEGLAPDPGGFLRLDRVRARAGINTLEVRVCAEHEGALRGYWALTNDAEQFARPEWLEPDDESRDETVVCASTVLHVGAQPSLVRLQLGTLGPATLRMNGRTIAVQGGFDPYGSQLRVLPYDVTRYVHQGDNSLQIQLVDRGRPLAVLVDGLIGFADGTETSLVSDSTWALTRDDVRVRTKLRRDQVHDARWALLRARPHPLPRTCWLDSEAGTGAVIDVVPDANLGQPKRANWFRTVVPVGARRVVLPLGEERVRAWLDGDELVVRDRMSELAGSDRLQRVLALRVEPCDGRVGGALWRGPLRFECGEGMIELGPWSNAGLGAYSGGVRYQRRLDCTDLGDRVVLDLGVVRGTAEVRVDGQLVGIRTWSPYRFDLTDALDNREERGGVEVEIAVYNTLAPYLDHASPTTMVIAGQLSSGLFGPVQLLTTEVERDDT